MDSNSAGISADIQPRIEVYEDGRRVPVAPRPPVLSSAFLGEDVILERHWTSQSAHYGEREQTTNTLFLYDGEPVRAAWRVGGKRLDARVRTGHLWIVPRSMPHTSSFQGPHGGVLLSITNSQLERHIGPLMCGRIELAPGFNVEDGQLEHLLRGLLAVAQDGSCANALVGDSWSTRHAFAWQRVMRFRSCNSCHTGAFCLRLG